MPNVWPESEQVATWWQEGFTDGADAEYEEQILPLVADMLGGSQRVLDVGCGEGQVSRLAGRTEGVELVVGVDPTWAQVEVAADRGGDVVFGGAEAAALPFSSSSFDAVIACLVFEHIEAVDEAVAEVARVLRPRGRFIFLLNHPLLQTPGSGWIDDRILDEQYWRIGPYLIEDNSLEEVEKDVWIPFIHRPLAICQRSGWRRASGHPYGGAGPSAGFLARAHEYSEAATIPRLLALRAERLG